jgi:polyhydroxybutyrate depolymerase
MRLALFLAAILACGCSSKSTDAPASDAAVDSAPADHVFGGDRPVTYFKAPDELDPSQPLPLVMVLHGYSAGGLVQVIYLRLEPLVNTKKFLLVAPDGNVDKKGNRFWNAVDSCCDFDGTKVDDVKYLTGLVDEIASVYNVDKKRVYLVGHSNGGAMSYRLACDASEKFAAAWVLAPPFWSDVSQCKPKAPIAIRHVHGTADTEVPYEGATEGTIVGKSAPEIAAAWAGWNGCDPKGEEGMPFDFDTKPPGPETVVTTYKNCKPNSTVELWTLTGSTHIPDLNDTLPETIWSFLSAHPRP